MHFRAFYGPGGKNGYLGSGLAGCQILSYVSNSKNGLLNPVPVLIKRRLKGF